MDKKDSETKLSEHKQTKRKLIPPLLQIPNLRNSPWLHDRLPEMLWAVLIIGNLEREKALNFFKHVASYVKDNKDCCNVTLSGLANFSEGKTKTFIEHMLGWSNEIPIILRPLRLYPEIPAYEVWSSLLNEPVPKEDWAKVLRGVTMTFDHQSQESTDCRWVKILCLIWGEKIEFTPELETKRKEILEYPNRGDMRNVRPSIRSMEILNFENIQTSWSKFFWKHNYKSTDCVPEQDFYEKTKAIKEKLAKRIASRRQYYLEEANKIRDEIIKYFFDSLSDTKVDARRETSFGLALYALSLFNELILYNTRSSITGRIIIRALVEVYINFSYLLKKEKEEPNIWEDFHSYGTGQAKLIYLKLKDSRQKIGCLNLSDIKNIVNEDTWAEFVPINLGHWDSSDLRKMSGYAEVKDVYDRFYNYTSSYVHGTRVAIRKSVYQSCHNLLHRAHRIPSFEFPLMNSVIDDTSEILNKIIECFSRAYPPFNYKLKPL